MLRRQTINWNKYNFSATMHEVTLYKSVLDETNDIQSYAVSYSHVFFEDYDQARHLNTSCKKLIQFGASVGKFLTGYKKSGWNVIAYDYSSVAIQALKTSGIDAKQVDLNQIDETNNLTYAKQLIEDVASPSNILLIRILQYMDLPALNLFLFTLIEHAAPGSVFFIAGNANSIEEESSTGEMTSRTRGYKASFFAPRTDMEFIEGRIVNANDELLVIRKR